MSLLDKLTKDMVAAMKAKDKETLSTVRMLKASVQNEKIKLGHELSEEEEFQYSLVYEDIWELKWDALNGIKASVDHKPGGIEVAGLCGR